MAYSILIVDDNTAFREHVAARLRLDGYQVSESGSGRDAIPKFRAFSFDLVLIGLVLPDMQGLDLLERIRRLKEDTTVVIIAEDPDVSSAIGVLRSGADDLIDKNSGADGILDRVRKTLRKLEARRDPAHVQEQYRIILENLNDAIGAVDREGRINYISPSIKKILGYEQDEMIGRSFMDFVHPADKERVESEVQKYTKQASTYINTNRIVDKDGNVVWARFSSAPLMKNGEVTAIHTVLTDISETKKLQEELIRKESRAQAGELAAFVAHDINTPLQGVLSILEHCRAEYEGRRELLEYINLMHSGLLKIKSTVLNLLELEHPVIYETTDVNLYLNKVFHLAKSYLRSYGIEVELYLEPEVPNASISTKDFEQLLLEIIREDVWLAGREDWDTYPALSVFETGRRIADNRPEDEGEELFKQRKWRIESASDDGSVLVIFHNMMLDEADDGSMIRSILEENNCTMEFEGIPGAEKTLTIGIPPVQDD